MDNQIIKSIFAVPQNIYRAALSKMMAVMTCCKDTYHAALIKIINLIASYKKNSRVELDSFITILNTWYEKRDIYVGMLASSLFINILALVFPLTLLQVYDRIIPRAATSTLLVLVIGVIIALALEAFLRIMRSLVCAWGDARYEHIYSKDLFDTTTHLHLKDFEKKGAGVHLERFRAIQSIKNFYGGQALVSMIDLPFILLYIIMIAYIGRWAVIVPLLMLCGLSAVVSRLDKKLREALRLRAINDDRKINFLIEMLGGIASVKALAMENQILRRYERLQAKAAENNYKISLINSDTLAITQFISQLTIVLLVAVGSMMVTHHMLTAGGLAACILLTGRLLQFITTTMGVWGRMRTVKTAEKRFDDLKTLALETTDKQPTTILSGNICFENVSFAYTPQEQLLKNINLTIQANESIAVTGRGLSGKSSLLYLIMGLFTPTSGIITLDGQNITQIDPISLRKNIAYLPAYGELFEGTLLENLTLFREGEYITKAKELIKKLKLDEAIGYLPHGYETKMGDRIIDVLPSGLKQSICLVRALLDEPRILLFDEANTTVDLYYDHLIKQMLGQLKGKCTLVMVSNRSSILAIADRVYELSAGNLIEKKHD